MGMVANELHLVAGVVHRLNELHGRSSGHTVIESLIAEYGV